ncbi:MAG TPA: hypothetical protein VGL86_13850 [Polyangia bacterium]|jgi:hypothetical protein
MAATIRARHPQMLLALLAERHPSAHQKAMTTLACADKLGHALPVEWLPIAIDVEVVDVVARQLSPSVMEALVSERQRQEMGSALFKTFVSTAQKLFGLSPATFIRHLNRGWQQIFSECGTIEVVRVEKHAGVVMLRALPEICLQSSAWIGALPAGMRVLYELVNTTGAVTVTRRGADVELAFAW